MKAIALLICIFFARPILATSSNNGPESMRSKHKAVSSDENPPAVYENQTLTIQSGKTKMSIGRYIGSWGTATMIGFGLGYSMQGRWQRGKTFLVIGIVSIVTLITGIVIVPSSRVAQDYQPTTSEKIGQYMLTAGAIGFGGARAFEIIDVITYPLHDDVSFAFSTQKSPPDRSPFGRKERPFARATRVAFHFNF